MFGDMEICAKLIEYNIYEDAGMDTRTDKKRSHQKLYVKACKINALLIIVQDTYFVEVKQTVQNILFFSGIFSKKCIHMIY